MRPLTVGIVGGSLAGLFAAVMLQRDGHKVTIHERSARGLGGRGAGLVPQIDLFTILRRMDLEELAKVGVLAKERIYLDRDGEIVQAVRSPQLQISWDYLYSTVTSQFSANQYLLGRKVEGVIDNEHNAGLQFADGVRETFDLVIGADGIGSVVRKSLHSEAYRNDYAGYVAWRFLIPETAIPHESRILVDRFTFFIVPGNQVLGYLVPGEKGEMQPGARRYNCVWYRRVHEADLSTTFTDLEGRVGAFSLPRGGLSIDRRTELRNDASRLLPLAFSKLIRTEEKPWMQGIYDYVPPSMIGKSTVLMGDAAFVARPHTAMGVSKAASEAMALVKALEDQDNLQTALRLYNNERMPIGRQIVALGQRLGAAAL